VLEVRHGGGTFLRHLDPASPPSPAVRSRRDRLPAVLEARRALEVPIAASPLSGGPTRISRASSAGSDGCVEEVADGDIGSIGDAAFHAAVTTAAHNPVLADLMAHLASDVAETRAESLSQPERPPALARRPRGDRRGHRGRPTPTPPPPPCAHLDHVAELRLFDWTHPATHAVTEDAP
jgi:GntR family transcriptional regulator, transcriptional repressor for pyruvate dehydrogenase complex